MSQLIVPATTDKDKLIDELAKVVARHLRGGVAHLSSELKQSEFDPQLMYLEVKFLITKRPWTAIERMREAVEDHK